HKISELVLCKDRIFTNITPQVFTLTPTPPSEKEKRILPHFIWLAYKWKEERYNIVYCSSLPIYEKTNPDYCT
ncbi:hypothetical protein, partial [Bacteroides stercoris]|uniref:hypothetical protein n=1 Tax=Bacteroides stercoris TaxID=46506 RepID=UPI001E427ACD